MSLKPLSELVNFFYPPRCLACDKVGAVVHPACRSSFPFILDPLCDYCGLPLPAFEASCTSSLCLRSPNERTLDRVRSVFRHSQGARQGVLRLKYKGVSSVTEWLVRELTGAAQRHKLDKANAVVAVPLHPKRQRERGYNQAGLLAQGVAHYLNLPLYEDILVRRRETRSQVGLGGRERSENVLLAFAWQGHSLAGQNLLIVDDVCTTGATLSECARVLKEAAAAQVWGLTVTREFRDAV